MHYANEAEEKLENIKRNIVCCRERIETIRCSLTRTNVELTPDRIQTSTDPNSMIDGIIGVLEFEDKLSRLIKEGTEFISLLDSEQMQMVCFMFYIEDLSVCDIAKVMRYTSRRINQMKQDANIQLTELIQK